MTKHSLFNRIIIIIWVIVLFRLCLPPYVLWDNILEFGSSFIDFKFTFSFSHFLNLTAACIFLYFIRNWIYDHDKKVQLSAMMRYFNTLKDHDSFFVKLFLVVFPLSIMIFTFSAIYKFTQIPEILFLIILFTIIGFFELKKDTKAPDNFEKNTYLFTDDPIKKYSQLNDFQRTEVNQLKSILDAGLDDYLSIALNGSWGSGKTSILNGLKNLLENGDPESENFKSNYEVFELNLWQARTPENAIDELDRLFTELFNKVYLNVSSNDLAFFSLLSGSENSWLSTSLKTLLGDTDSMPTSLKRLNAKLEQVLNRLKKQKLVILIDDLDRLPEQYLNGFLKIICYVTGLKNVVTISGINKEKIHLKYDRTNDITILADGESPSEHYKWIGEAIKGQKKDGSADVKKSNKVEYKFTHYENESFLSKIFSIQIELINSDYHVKSYIKLNKERIENFHSDILFEDSDEIIGSINNFIERNSLHFKNYREIKLYLNEVFIYLIGFGGDRDRQIKIKISDYVEINSILALSWAKIVYPDFFKKIFDYVILFKYQEQGTYNDIKISDYNIKRFLENQFQYFDEGRKEYVPNKALNQIRLIFNDHLYVYNKISGDTSINNQDAAIKYFYPVIEPYEFNTFEFSKTYDDKPDVKQIAEFLKRKWEMDPKNVFIDFVRRIKLRKFEIYERLNTALALVSFPIPNFQPNRSNRDERYWGEILSLLGNRHGLEDNSKLFIDIQTEDKTIIHKMFDLWESKYYCLGISTEMELTNIIQNENLFYKFFNQSAFQNQNNEIRQTYYELLFKEIGLYSFKSDNSKVACLIYVYKLTIAYWEDNIKDQVARVKILDGLDLVFLNGFFSLLQEKEPNPVYLFNDFSLVYQCIRLKHDQILFKPDNLKKLIHLFENHYMDFNVFIQRIRLDRSDGCLLSNDQAEIARKRLLAYIKSESDYFGKGYEETIEKFFKPKVTANEIDESRLSAV